MPRELRPPPIWRSSFPTLFGPKGLVVDSQAVLPDGSTHSAHFNSGFQTEFTQFNIALASQLAAVSLPSPASGYTYAFDPTLGVFQRSTQSFGPILSDRAETIGKGKFTFGFNFQRFTFDTIEGVDLNAVPAVFTHDDAQLGGGRRDVVTTTNSISTQVSQFNSFFTYGISKQVDVSLALPVINVDMNLGSVATIHRIGTASNPAIHYFADASGGFGDTRNVRVLGLGQRSRRRHPPPEGQRPEERAHHPGPDGGHAFPDAATSATSWARAPGACGPRSSSPGPRREWRPT